MIDQDFSELFDRIRTTLGATFAGTDDWLPERTSDGRPVWSAGTPGRDGRLVFTTYPDEEGEDVLVCAAIRGGAVRYMRLDPGPGGQPLATPLADVPLADPGLN